MEERVNKWISDSLMESTGFVPAMVNTPPHKPPEMNDCVVSAVESIIS